MTATIVFLDRATVPAHICFNDLNIEHHWLDYTTTSPSEIVSRAIEADVIVTNKVVLDANILAQLPKLKHIAVIATGYNNIDLDACKAQGISVSNTPNYSVTSVPEHTLALIFALRRHLFAYQANIRQGRWQQSPFFHDYIGPTFDLKGAQLGIIGGGSLGSETAALARAIGMKVVFADRKNSKTPSQRADYLPFDELISSSDVISLHCPLTEETQNIIAMAELEAMKPEALLINTARGGLVNEADLVNALKRKRIAGAGFDVASREPIEEHNPLLSIVDLPNFILTPHVAWTSDASLQRQAGILIDNIEHFLQGKSLNRVV